MLVLFCMIVSIGSVFASDLSDSSDNLTLEDSDSIDNLNAVEDVDSEKLSESISQESKDNLSVSENDGEVLSQDVNSSDDVLSSSVSVSSPHTYNRLGYTFTVSASQYKDIRDAINAGKKQKFVDWGFKFKVKTNKVIKVKVLKNTKTYYKKVRYEGLTPYPYNSIKLANLKSYYNKGWKKYWTGFESVKNSRKYLGYNYVKLKKVVKTYKTVSMRVYAKVTYVGEYDYNYDHPHYYFPVVEFYAMKSGYSSKYLDGTFIR